MKVTFEYNKEKDIWCLLKFGKSSDNSSSQTKVYTKLVEENGEDLTTEETSVFIDKYLLENKLDIQDYIENYQKDLETISDEYTKIAERVFKVSLPKNITAYLTINDRCPYSIGDNFFMVSFPTRFMRKVVMHELWHFYTWYKFGVIWEEKLGKQKYNDLKESLTVLLNVECKDLFLDGAHDGGYPQHKELREKVINLWNESKDVDNLWNELVK